MGFKLPGKSVHTGTDAHRSALKETRATSYFRGEEGFIPDEFQGGDKRRVVDGKYEDNPDYLNRTETSYLAGEEGLIPDELQGGDKSTIVDGKVVPKKQTEGKSSKPRAAYGGDGRTWEQANKDSGGDLNQTTRDQKAYERQMKAQNPNWNKREDNQWKKRQNTINAAVGSKKVYEVDSEVEKIKDAQVVRDKKIVDEGETRMAEEGPKQTNEEGEKVYGSAGDVTADLNKSELKTTKQLQRQKVKDARKEFGRRSDEVKAAKATKKDEIKKTRKMVRTNKKDQKFTDRDEALDRRITKRKEKGRGTTRLEKRKATNLRKEKKFGESLG